ncbi:hypothetical protein ACIP9H_08335 [Streptomyces sp. NPDC088732]|uniref:hypothetical protein n=1 Tax=Streptomyces sp. NPDC088732 TaxID=3365879 RepID=UPI00381B8A8F
MSGFVLPDRWGRQSRGYESRADEDDDAPGDETGPDAEAGAGGSRKQSAATDPV